MSKENTKKEKVEVPEMECNQKVEEPKIMNVTMATVDENETDYKDLYLRTLADMDNLRKNTNKRISEIYSTANEKLVVEMLPYLDALDLAIYHHENNEIEKTGYEVLRKQLTDILARFGVKEIEIVPNELFDADKMNAIMVISSGSLAQHGAVANVAKKGYTLNDKVIRYADVVIYDSAA